ncbi:MAG: PTS-dependent dihydroxyacetone kinase phosphotransferase subunit DhaM [Propionibacteriaceae bacterium]|jgi:PTS hybrid protein|nr:PTS-dependent dihydroxyacetone kinase phosphotransferase subunit DhaM [Propionibacteriaceae bacterium]
MSVGLVICSHSAKLAEGVAELAGQMAKAVTIVPAGGTGDGRIGTSVELVSAAVEKLLDEGLDVAVLTDLGSATMTVESVIEALGPDRAAHVRHAEGPLVEGAVAASVAAQIGGDLTAVALAAQAKELFA